MCVFFQQYAIVLSSGTMPFINTAVKFLHDAVQELLKAILLLTSLNHIIMVIKCPPSKLEPGRQELLKQFMSTFIKRRIGKRLSRKNEIEYISSILDRLFIHYFNFSVPMMDVLRNFMDSSYGLYGKAGLWDESLNKFVPSSAGTHVRTEPVYKMLGMGFFYIMAAPECIERLRLVTARANSLNTVEKRFAKEETIKKILLFREGIQITSLAF